MSVAESLLANLPKDVTFRYTHTHTHTHTNTHLQMHTCKYTPVCICERMEDKNNLKEQNRALRGFVH